MNVMLISVVPTKANNTARRCLLARCLSDDAVSSVILMVSVLALPDPTTSPVDVSYTTKRDETTRILVSMSLTLSFSAKNFKVDDTVAVDMSTSEKIRVSDGGMVVTGMTDVDDGGAEVVV